MQQEWKNLLRKMSIEKEKQKLILGRCDHDRALPWDRKKKKKKPKRSTTEETRKAWGLGSLKRKEQMLCVKCSRKTEEMRFVMRWWVWPRGGSY